MIKLEQLKTFLTVVRAGGMRKATEVLNLTQPAITSRIRNLEESLSSELFDRTSSGVKLTKKGELLLAHAEKFEHMTAMLEQDMISPWDLEGRLHIGVSETIAQSWLPDMITKLHRTYPNLKIDLDVDISVHLRSALMSNSIDLAIMMGPVSEYSVNNMELPALELAWYLSSKALIPSDPVSLLSRPIWTYARNTRPYRELEDLLFEKVGPGVSLFPSSSISACFRLVEADQGIAVLPRALAREFLEAGTIREFEPGWVPSPLRFTASYLGRPRNHVTENAAQIAVEVATEFMGR